MAKLLPGTTAINTNYILAIDKLKEAVLDVAATGCPLEVSVVINIYYDIIITKCNIPLFSNRFSHTCFQK